MDEKTKELIAIGASVAGHCQPCLTFHVDQARDLGIGDDEIRAAVAVGKMVEKAAVVGIDDEKRNKGGCCGDGGCC